jgi:hypothetical protein
MSELADLSMRTVAVAVAWFNRLAHRVSDLYNLLSDLLKGVFPQLTPHVDVPYSGLDRPVF